MKVLCIGDLHFRPNNIESAQILTRKILIAVKRFEPDIVVFLGDTLHYHEKLHTQPLNVAIELFYKVSSLCKTFVLVGNHDYINPSQFLSTEHWLNVLKYWKTDIIVVDKVIKYTYIEEEDDMESYSFILTPYVPKGRFIEALDKSEEMWQSVDAIFTHNDFFGRKEGEIIREDGDKWEENYPPIFSGHIHEPQFVSPNIHYVGSAMQQNYGEKYNKTLALLTFDSSEEGITYNKLNLKMKRKITLRVSLGELDELNMKEYSNDDVKIVIQSPPEDFLSFKKSKRFRELKKNCTTISHEDVCKDSKETNELLEKFSTLNRTDYKEILFTLIKDDEGQQKVFEEATGEKYIDVSS